MPKPCRSAHRRLCRKFQNTRGSRKQDKFGEDDTMEAVGYRWRNPRRPHKERSKTYERNCTMNAHISCRLVTCPKEQREASLTISWNFDTGNDGGTKSSAGLQRDSLSRQTCSTHLLGLLEKLSVCDSGTTVRSYALPSRLHFLLAASYTRYLSD